MVRRSKRGLIVFPGDFGLPGQFVFFAQKASDITERRDSLFRGELPQGLFALGIGVRIASEQALLRGHIMLRGMLRVLCHHRRRGLVRENGGLSERGGYAEEKKHGKQSSFHGNRPNLEESRPPALGGSAWVQCNLDTKLARWRLGLQAENGGGGQFLAHLWNMRQFPADSSPSPFGRNRETPCWTGVCAGSWPFSKADSNPGLDTYSGCVLLRTMATEKNPTKDVILWIVAIVLVVIAIFWYRR